MVVLKLDWDRKIVNVFKYFDRLWFVSRKLDLKIKEFRVFETRKGMHIYIDVRNRLSDPEIVFIQLLAGSDWKREVINLKRIRNGVPMSEGNKLFKAKYIWTNGEAYLHGREEQTWFSRVYEKALNSELKKKVVM